MEQAGRSRALASAELAFPPELRADRDRVSPVRVGAHEGRGKLGARVARDHERFARDEAGRSRARRRRRETHTAARRRSRRRRPRPSRSNTYPRSSEPPACVRPGAREDADGAQPRDEPEGVAHASLVVESRVSGLREVSRPLARKPVEGRTVPALRSPAVPDDVRRHAEEPRERGVAVEPDLLAPPPGLEEDDRRQVLGEGPVRRAAEAVVVDGPRMPLEERSERGRLTRDGELCVGCGAHQISICPVRSGGSRCEGMIAPRTASTPPAQGLQSADEEPCGSARARTRRPWRRSGVPGS